MKYEDTVTWTAKPLDEGLLIRTLKMLNVGNITNRLQPYGLSPMAGLPMSKSTIARHMGFEGGTGICVANATEKYGKPGTLFRRKLRIDKCPWVGGQQDIRLRITISFGHTIGNNGAGAEPKVYLRRWFRDSMMPFSESFSSNVAPATDFMRGLGYQDASGTIRVTLTPRDFNPIAGNPEVWNSENGLVESYVECLWTDPTFTQGVTYIAMLGPPYFHYFVIDCPHWSTHHLNFSEGFVSVFYAHPLGVVQGVGATIEATGWDTGWHDIEGWHEGTTEDPYSIPKPNSYEYPNYPIENPFNPTGDGVG